MKIIAIIIIISFLGIFILLIWILKNMAKLKKQNDMIYEEECKKIAEEIDENIPYDFEFTSTAIREIDMSTRLRKCLNIFLETHGIAEDLDHIAMFSKKDILFNCKNMGKKSMEELETLMRKYNLKFKR